MGYIARECNKDLKGMLSDEKEGLDSGNCSEFEKVQSAMEKWGWSKWNHHKSIEDILDRLVLDKKELWPKVFAYDFNTWGSLLTSAAGRCLLEPFGKLDSILADDGQVYPNQKEGSGSIVDVNLVSPSLACGMSWTVSEQ